MHNIKSATSVKELVFQYASYNLWANSRVLDLIGSLPSEKLDLEMKSSFPTIRKTVFHIWDAETIWLKRLHNESLISWPSKEFDAKTDLKKMLQTSKGFVDFLSGKDSTYYNDVTTYKNTGGVEFTTANSGIIMHVMNHSSFHRGQIITMVRELGFSGEIPSTDLITYLRLE